MIPSQSGQDVYSDRQSYLPFQCSHVWYGWVHTQVLKKKTHFQNDIKLVLSYLLLVIYFLKRIQMICQKMENLIEWSIERLKVYILIVIQQNERNREKVAVTILLSFLVYDVDPTICIPWLGIPGLTILLSFLVYDVDPTICVPWLGIPGQRGHALQRIKQLRGSGGRTQQGILGITAKVGLGGGHRQSLKSKGSTRLFMSCIEWLIHYLMFLPSWQYFSHIEITVIVYKYL